MSSSEKGFTSIELLVAISIALGLVGFVYEAYFFTMRMNASWQRKMEVDNTGWICMHRLSRDLIRAEQLSNLSDSSATLTNTDHRRIVYSLRNGVLFRNGMRLNHPPVVFQTCRILPIPLISKDMSGFMENKTQSKSGDEDVLVQIEIAYGDGAKTVSLQTVVFPRNPIRMNRTEP